MKKIIELRSDTFTKPSLQMRQAMANAEVGDDVFGEDPTVNELQEYVAALLGKEAGLFVSSGTQGNLLAQLAHCQRGEEVICGLQSHIFAWEAGGASVVGGIRHDPLSFEIDGRLDLARVEKMIKPDDTHFAITKLLALENTYNGKVLPLEYLAQAAALARTHNLLLHMDGARVFNAAIALGVNIKKIVQYVDSVTFCLSKGLGAPIGSVLCGSKEFIKRAHRWRKIVGGGMRQVGIIAAAGLYALKNNVSRLAQDHEHAALLGKGLGEIEALCDNVEVNTNMVWVKVGTQHAHPLHQFLKQQGIMTFDEEVVRLVTHLDIERDDVLRVVDVVKEYYRMQRM